MFFLRFNCRQFIKKFLPLNVSNYFRIDVHCTDMNINKFISENSFKLFTRFGIDTSFLQYDPKSWDNHISFVYGKE